MWRRSPFDELFDVFRDFDGLFRRTFADLAPMTDASRLLTTGSSGESSLAPATFALSPWVPRRHGVPAVESYLKEGKIFIRLELPGVDPSDVQVSLTGNRLQIGGEKKASQEVNENDVWIREISQGRFHRCFTLPEGVNGDEIKARFENGVLELSMPAPASEEPKRVAIKIDTPGGKHAKAA